MRELRRLNNAVHVTAARLRFLLNMKNPVWAAARDGKRYAPTSSVVAALGELFMNIFEILGVATREDVNTNVLVFAFSNSVRFRTHLLNKIAPGLDSLGITWQAHPRVGLTGIGVPDAVLVGTQGQIGFLILIENKLTADEGNEQTTRYASKEAISALTHQFLPGVNNVQPYFLFLTLFPDLAAGSDAFRPLTHRELFGDFEILDPDQLQERLIADWQSIIGPFYAREQVVAMANVSQMLQDDGGLDAGYLYFRKMMQQVALPNGLWSEGCWRDSRQGRKYYGAKFSKDGWQTNNLYEGDKKWQFDGRNHDIHLEPQYNVLHGSLAIFLHYETCPYRSKKLARENIRQECLNRYLEDRNNFLALLRTKNVPGWAIGGGWNQVAKLTVDFRNLTTQQATDVLTEAFDKISTAVDGVCEELC